MNRGATNHGGATGGARAGRVATVAVLLLGLIGAGGLGEATRAFQRKHSPVSGGDQNAAGGPSLSELDSYALALMLGGLRGPLVMVLWINSENQKIEHDLEGLDTQIEWIRLLQPEFDTVHLFQIWNKAYNISVQMVGLGNKYATILDALDYAKGVLQERPNNLNVLSEVSRVYSHKLGSSNEKDYYRRRIRNETLPPIRVTMPAARADEFRQALANVGEADAGARLQTNGANGTASAVLTSVAANKLRDVFAGDGVTYKNVADEILRKGQPGWRRLRMDVLLDEKGNILPEYEHELRYLKPFEPFPYGLSPFPLAYNYAKWAKDEMERTGEDPKNVSRIVISSGPGLELKQWAEQSLERARRFELRAFDIPFPAADRFAAEVATAGIPPAQRPTNAWAVAPALHALDRAVQVSAAAIEAYEDHLKKPEGLGRRSTYQSHLEGLQSLHDLARADADYLRAMTRAANPVEQQNLLKSAHEHYLAARTMHEDMIIAHYLDKSVLDQYAPGAWDRLHATGASVMADRSTRTPLLRQVLALLRTREIRRQDPNWEDRNEYERYLEREDQRLRLIEAALNLPPSTPELSPFTPVSPLSVPGLGTGR